MHVQRYNWLYYCVTLYTVSQIYEIRIAVVSQFDRENLITMKIVITVTS